MRLTSNFLLFLLSVLLILLLPPPSSSPRNPCPLSASYNAQPSIKIPITFDKNLPHSLPLVPIKLGNPPQTLNLLLDIGSDTSWTFCDQYFPFNNNNTHTFDYSLSSTFNFINCSSPLCNSIDKCSSPTDPCSFTCEYEDGSSATGYWATETISVKIIDGSNLKINGIMIGCSKRESTNFTGADGVLALSSNSPSFTNQVASKLGKRIFSYRLANHDEDHHLVFGITKRTDFSREDNMQYVRLIDSSYYRPSLYFVMVVRLWINDVVLDIPDKVWEFNVRDGSGGVILDTGTTFTYIPQVAFYAFRNYFVDYFVEEYDNYMDVTNSEICFEPYVHEFERDYEFLRLGIEFEGGGQLVPLVENLYYRNSKGMNCLAVWPINQSEGSIIGSSFQKGYFWEYDLVNKKVGFAPIKNFDEAL